jgi:hypothetical protein
MPKDMFNLDSDNDQDQDGEGIDYVLLQLISAEGWRAVFNDETTGGTGTRTLGLACFALVEIIPDIPGEMPPQRVVRPMVANEHGQIDDVEVYEEFICLVPPGTELNQHVEYVIRKRGTEDK